MRTYAARLASGGAPACSPREHDAPCPLPPPPPPWAIGTHRRKTRFNRLIPVLWGFVTPGTIWVHRGKRAKLRPQALAHRVCHTGYELRTGYTGGSGRSFDPRLCYTGYDLGTPGEAIEASIPGFVTPGTNYELGTPGEAGEAALPGFVTPGTNYELCTPGEACEAAIPGFVTPGTNWVHRGKRAKLRSHAGAGFACPARLRDIPPRARSHAF